MPVTESCLPKSFMLSTAVTGLREILSSWRLWSLLGWIEIRQRYARSAVRPFLLTNSMAVMIGSIGAVHGTMFGQNLSDYFPFLSVGLVMWLVFTQIVNKGATVYIQSAHSIQQVVTPKLLFVLQVVW